MYPEYLYNNDTQDMSRRVQALAAKDEPALRAHCLEVSRQTDTSSLAVQKDCIAKVGAAHAVLANMMRVLKELSQTLASRAGVFHTQNGQADFPVVCRAVTEIEEARGQLLSCVGDLTQARHTLASCVADANRTLHLLSLAVQFVPESARSHYVAATEQTKVAYTLMTGLDGDVREALNSYMTFIERHLPAFMERLRSAADFNHAGAALDPTAIRTLCGELFILAERLQNVSF